MTDDCKKIITHINRVQGQMDALKRALEEEKSCGDIAHLVLSICASCESVRVRVLEHYIEEMTKNGSMKKREKDWDTIRSLLKR